MSEEGQRSAADLGCESARERGYFGAPAGLPELSERIVGRRGPRQGRQRGRAERQAGRSRVSLDLDAALDLEFLDPARAKTHARAAVSEFILEVPYFDWCRRNRELARQRSRAVGAGGEAQDVRCEHYCRAVAVCRFVSYRPAVIRVRISIGHRVPS